MDGVRRYVLKKPDGEVTGPTRLGMLMIRVKLRARKMSPPFSVNGGEPEPRKTAVDGFEAALRRAHVGEFQRLDGGGNAAIRAKPVHLKVKILQTNGNWKIDRYFGSMVSQFGRLNVYGVTVCKSIGTTSTPSQHCDWPPLDDWRKHGFPNKSSSAGGNAIDLNADKRTMKAMFHRSIHDAKELDTENVIHWPYDSPHPLIWNPEQGIHQYVIPPGGSNHKSHVHWDASPTRSGRTRC